MGLSKVLLGESYTAVTGRIDAMDIEPTDHETSAEDIARARLVDKFVSTLLRPDINYDDWWSEEASFAVRGADIESLNSSVIWVRTNLSGQNSFSKKIPIVIDYPWFVVGVNFVDKKQQML